MHGRVQQQVIQAVAEYAHMTTESLHGVGYALVRDGTVKAVCAVVVSDGRVCLPLCRVEQLRECAQRGLQARAIFATPDGIFAKKIEDGPIDGWIGLSADGDGLSVCFGDLIVGDKVMCDEQQPMTRLMDSDPRWFVEDG